jgi:putative protease
MMMFRQICEKKLKPASGLQKIRQADDSRIINRVYSISIISLLSIIQLSFSLKSDNFAACFVKAQKYESKQMNKNIPDFEVMAPVGSYDSLAAAIQGGADSIYFGIEGLNMRARSSNNFTIDDLKQIAAVCKEKGLKSYLTVNTIIYDNDIALMHRIVNAAKEAELSAIIASDVAVMMYARSIGVEVHLSTQLNITNTEALKFYGQFADVVVLARELNLDQVASIYKDIVEQNIKGPEGELIRIEMFSHGALCMAVSGKCYLSLHEKAVSANRGACNQICRRGYIVKDKDSEIELEIDNEYIMSPKDLKTIHFINKMMDAGVRVFKIEGRARGPEYVRTVVECYKEAIKACCGDTFTEDKVADWDERLATVFNRGFWDGYYLGQRLGEWSGNYGSGATKRKLYIGKGIKYFSDLGVAEFLMETQSLKTGDEILITGPTTGAISRIVEEIRVDLKPVKETVKGEKFSIKVDDKIRPSDKLFKLVKVEQTKKFVEK